jgi:uncharacterized repeat protein (TIGR01451 family)
VANTTAPPVSCSDVRIDLSTDGGYTYPIALAESTPNDGSQAISVPGMATTTARVRVSCLSNIFFDISDADFAILAPDLTIDMTHSGTLLAGQPVTFTITVSNIGVGPSAGLITVTDTLPATLVASSLSGDGWDCDLDSLTCTIADSLPGASSLPAITLVAIAAPDVPLLVFNTATVSGGGDTLLDNNLAIDQVGDGCKVYLPAVIR